MWFRVKSHQTSYLLISPKIANPRRLLIRFRAGKKSTFVRGFLE